MPVGVDRNGGAVQSGGGPAAVLLRFAAVLLRFASGTLLPLFRAFVPIQLLPLAPEEIWLVKAVSSREQQLDESEEGHPFL